MITVRALLAFAFSVALAACQQPGKAPAAAKKDPLAEALASAEADMARNYEPSPDFKAKGKDLVISMMDRMLTKCMDATTEEAMQGCYHERMLVGFDSDGTLRRQCKPRAVFEDDLKCILFGSVGQEIRSKLIDKAAAPFDWTAPEKSARLVMRQLVLEQFRTCLDSGSASDPFDCFVGRITEALDLSSADLDRCAEHKDDDTKFGLCIGETYALKYMNAAVARM